MMSMGNCKNNLRNNKAFQEPLLHFTRSIHLRVQDAKGNDLLYPKSKGNYNNSNIKVLESDDANNAVYIAKYHPNSDFYYIRLNLNLFKPKHINNTKYTKETITKVKFGNNKPDSIKGLYTIGYHKGSNQKGFGTSSGYTIILQKAWFNDVLIYNKEETENNPDWEVPIIVKEPD